MLIQPPKLLSVKEIREIEIWYGNLTVWKVRCACEQGGIYRNRIEPFRTAIKRIGVWGLTGVNRRAFNKRTLGSPAEED